MQNKEKVIKDILARPNCSSDEGGLSGWIEVSESENKILLKMFFWRKTYHFTFFILLSVLSIYMAADIASRTFAWLYSQKRNRRRFYNPLLCLYHVHWRSIGYAYTSCNRFYPEGRS